MKTWKETDLTNMEEAAIPREERQANTQQQREIKEREGMIAQ